MSTDAIKDAAERFYTVLHAAEVDSREQAEQLLPLARRRVDQYRAILAELRELEHAAAGELTRWEQTAASLARSIDPDSPEARDGLRGQQIAEAAATLYRAGEAAAEPVRYDALLELLHRAGYRIPTANPQASLLTALQRSKAWEPIGGRSGLWRLAEESLG